MFRCPSQTLGHLQYGLEVFCGQENGFIFAQDRKLKSFELRLSWAKLMHVNSHKITAISSPMSSEIITYGDETGLVKDYDRTEKQVVGTY